VNDPVVACGRYPLIPNGYGSIFFPTWSGRCNPMGCGSTKSIASLYRLWNIQVPMRFFKI